VLSVLLPITDSEYTFGIFKLIAEILLKVALNTMNESINQSKNPNGTLTNIKWEELASTSNRRYENLQR